MDTIFLDIDGCLIRQDQCVYKQILDNTFPDQALPGVVEKMQEWEQAGYKIILTTGRREYLREFTVKQLTKMGIWYDQLIMDVGSQRRFLINDIKPYSPENTAVAINLERNQGIGDLNLDDL